MVGQTFYPPADVIGVILGQDVAGATFTVGRLRLPRAVLAVLVGLCFGIGGVTFQTMLRNPLASPDIIGISSGASAAAAFGIVTLSLGASEVSFFAIFVGLGVAILIYVLSFKGGVTGTRLILIGIGIAAMLDSITNYVLSQAAQWDLQEALRWLNGSLNGASWNAILPVAISIVVLVPILLAQSRSLSATTPQRPSGCASTARGSSSSSPPSACSPSRQPLRAPSPSSRSSPAPSPPGSSAEADRSSSPPASSEPSSCSSPTSSASSSSAPATPSAS